MPRMALMGSFVINLQCFEPDPARAALLDQRAREALAISLAKLFTAFSGVLTWDGAASVALLDALRDHAVSPGLFAVYAELVEAAFSDDMTAAKVLLDILLRPELRCPHLARVVTLAVTDLGEGVPAIYRRVIDDDPSLVMDLGPVNEAEMMRFRAILAESERLLWDAAPALAGEMVAVAREIVLVLGAASFDGATSFYLWGAITFNAARETDRVRLAEAIAHEVGHACLLGASLGAPLVRNDPAQRFASPLRADRRPMDGIVHACFVLARMIWCQDTLLANSCLDRAESAAVARRRARNVERFASGAKLIAEHASFTETGAALWQSALSWMNETLPSRSYPCK